MVKQQYFLLQIALQQKSTTNSTKIKNYYNKEHVFVAIKKWSSTILFCTDSHTTKIITYFNKTQKRSQLKTYICNIFEKMNKKNQGKQT